MNKNIHPRSMRFGVDVMIGKRLNGWWFARTELDGVSFQAESRSRNRAIKKLKNQLHTVEIINIKVDR